MKSVKLLRADKVTVEYFDLKEFISCQSLSKTKKQKPTHLTKKDITSLADRNDIKYTKDEIRLAKKLMNAYLAGE